MFGFLPGVAPVKACVFPLLQRENLNAIAQRLSVSLTRAGLRNIIDVTGERLRRGWELQLPGGCNSLYLFASTACLVGTASWFAMNSAAVLHEVVSSALGRQQYEAANTASKR